MNIYKVILVFLESGSSPFLRHQIYLLYARGNGTLAVLPQCKGKAIWNPNTIHPNGQYPVAETWSRRAEGLLGNFLS